MNYYSAPAKPQFVCCSECEQEPWLVGAERDYNGLWARNEDDMLCPSCGSQGEWLCLS